MLNKLKALLEITGTDSDELLKLLLDGAELAVKTYCNLETLPMELEDVVCRLAAGDYRANNFGREESDRYVKSVTRGDTSVTFSTEGELAAARNENPGFLDDYRLQMNAFRKMRWRR